MKLHFHPGQSARVASYLLHVELVCFLLWKVHEHSSKNLRNASGINNLLCSTGTSEEDKVNLQKQACAVFIRGSPFSLRRHARCLLLCACHRLSTEVGHFYCFEQKTEVIPDLMECRENWWHPQSIEASKDWTDVATRN